ncbi:MAG: flagellar hook capping protein [Lachnospiraceae bacterium]|nr:flagellar hook capping protein [Lachnospiraceae bacterium]
MSSVAYIGDDGKIVQSASQSSIESQVSKSSTSDMNKDTFLQLLVAQMKYQDPLEPTSNTEYISQYATFTQVEEIQNMASTMELSRASSLVGEEVIINTTGSDGSKKTVQGQVDYVTYENGKAYVSIDENLYSVSDVATIIDKQYMNAYDKAASFVARIAKLPVVGAVSEKELNEIAELDEIYNGMSDYEKTFVASDVVKSLEEYKAQAAKVKEAIEAWEKAQETEEESTNSDPESI